MSAADDIEREALRLFRILLEVGAHLARQPLGGILLLRRGDNGKFVREEVAAKTVEAFLQRGWLAGTPKAGRYVLSEAGAGWFARAVAADAPFAAQHQLRTPRRLRDGDGRARTVIVDEAESVVSRLKRRGVLDAAQFDAAEKLRRDFTIAQLMPRLGVDLEAPVVSGRRSARPELQMTDTILAAKQRFTRAMHAVGPGLSDLLFDIVCHLRGLEDAERAFGWPNRAARVVLCLALDRLADHYGLRVTGDGRIRGWRANDAFAQLENNTM